MPSLGKEREQGAGGGGGLRSNETVYKHAGLFLCLEGHYVSYTDRTLMTSYVSNYLPKSQLQMPSHWGLWLNMGVRGGRDKYMPHNRKIIVFNTPQISEWLF